MKVDLAIRGFDPSESVTTGMFTCSVKSSLVKKIIIQLKKQLSIGNNGSLHALTVARYVDRRHGIV